MTLASKMILICAGLAILLFAAGAGMVISSLDMPAYHDEDAYHEAISGLSPSTNKNATNLYYEAQDRYLTSKYLRFDRGVGLIAFASMLCVITAIAWYVHRSKKTIPRNLLRALPVMLVPLSLIPGIISVIVDFERYLFPSWADSIGIPIFGIATLIIILIPTLIFLAYFFTKEYRNRQPPLYGFFGLPMRWKAYFLVIILFCLYMSTEPVYENTFLVACVILFNYLLYIGLPRDSAVARLYTSK